MAELNPDRSAAPSDEGSFPSDPQLRLVTADDAVAIPENLPPSDDTPTIISKTVPASQTATAMAAFDGSLRGSMLAHFELIEPVGVGGMAAVIRARDTQLDRFVALKILPPELAADPDNVRRFQQEARAAAKLDHENIARVFYCGEDQRLHFIAFEFVEGENLRALLDRRDKLPVAEAVRYVLQIAMGLEHAASRGVVHRDVKPSNIIISPDGRAKLVDMGLARSLGQPKDDGLTQSGVTLGTFDYIAPEQAIEPRDADSRSDLYSLGCTFYHMLTGQRPTPEGTPAKKLHHHQNVDPVDPRQLNPEIPDEVVAILAGMMAKDPKNRYQRPAHLVQHLLQVARMVGAAEIPEGMKLDDIPLPGMPRKRPLLMVAAAAIALGLILSLLSLAPGPQHRGAFKPDQVGLDRLANRKDQNPDRAKPGPGLSGVYVVKSEQDLAQALADPRAATRAVLKNNIDIGEDGLVLKAAGKQQILIESADPLEPKTIRFKYRPQSENTDTVVPGFIAGLLAEGGSITFRHVRFEIEANETPNIAVAMLGVKGNATVRFDRCQFAQKDVPLRAFIPLLHKRLPIASIGLDKTGGNLVDRPRVILEQCLFEGGQAAVAVAGPAEVSATDCAFMPYGALFHLRGDCGDHGVALRVQRCSAFVARGPAFRLDDSASCLLHVEHSIFSCPDSFLKRDDPHLISQTESKAPAVRYEGLRNCYHNLFALWSYSKTPFVKLDEFRAEVQKAQGKDIDSSWLELGTSPWAAAEPLKQEPSAAFRLKSDLKEVRTADMKRGLGVENCVWGEMAALPPLTSADEPKFAGYQLKPNEKVVDPDSNGTGPRIFKTIFQAVAFHQPGDVLLIKQGKDRMVDVDPSRLDKPGIDLTLRPYPGHMPLLGVAQTSEKDAAMFRLHDGRIQFEQLEFVLRPDQELFEAHSVVLMGGNASCSFKNCVVTMQPSEKIKHSRRVPLSAVTLIDPDDAMKMPQRSGRTAAEIHFEDCFVRGEGEVVTVRVSRPLELDVQNSLIALSGSLLGVVGAAKEAPADAVAVVKLTRVSAFVTEPLIALRAGKVGKGLALTRVDVARDCLLVALGDRPLVHLESGDSSEEGLRGFLDWKAEHNAYVNFDKMVETFRIDDSLNAARMDASRWTEVYKEADSKFCKAQFAFRSGAPRSLWLSHVEDFSPRDEFKEELALFGATINSDGLPRQIPSKKADAGNE